MLIIDDGTKAGIWARLSNPTALEQTKKAKLTHVHILAAIARFARPVIATRIISVHSTGRIWTHPFEHAKTAPKNYAKSMAVIFQSRLKNSAQFTIAAGTKAQICMILFEHIRFILLQTRPFAPLKIVTERPMQKACVTRIISEISTAGIWMRQFANIVQINTD